MIPGLVAAAHAARAQLYEHRLYQAAWRAEELIRKLRGHIEGRLTPLPVLPCSGRVTVRELLIPSSACGYVTLYDIPNASQVTVIAVRHQLEEDYL